MDSTNETYIFNESDYPKVFVGYCLNDKIRRNSSSGGVFFLLGRYVIEKSGVVFGAKWNEQWKVVHGEAHDLKQLELFMGSKYVQSILGTVFIKCKSYLDQGKLVMFSGTPCQIEGLKAFLEKDYENLITVDFICHGVPSPRVWERYLEENTNKNVITNISFRDKTDGWKDFSLKIEYASGDIYRKTRLSDLYLRGFLRNIDLRPSCYVCRFKTRKRVSDFTLGDFWGVENIYTDIIDDKGCSLVFIHSLKGENVLTAVADQMKLWKITIDEAEKSNSTYMKSVDMPLERRCFFSELSEGKSVSKLLLKRTKKTLKQRIFYKLVHRRTRK